MRLTPLLGRNVGAGSAFPIVVELESRTGNLQGEVVVSVERGTERREYRYPLELPANARKRILATPVLNEWGGQVTVQFVAGRLRVRETLLAETRYEGQPLVALVGDAIGGLQFFQKIKIRDRDYTQQWAPDEPKPYADAYLNPALFPVESFPLSGVRVLVLGAGAERLRAEQWRAIREWVLLGGTLVVPGGSGSIVAQLPALRPLLPVEVGSTRQLDSLSAVGEFAGASPPKGSALISQARPKPTAFVLLRQGEVPLIVGQRYGMGTVFFLAFNPLDEPLQSYDARVALWERLLDYAPSQSPGALIRATHDEQAGVSQMSSGTAMPQTSMQVKLPSPLLIFALLSVYFVLVVPVNYLALKRFRMLDWAWLTTPLVALMFVGLIGWFTRELYRRPLSGEVKTLLMVPANGNEGYAISSVLFFFPRAGAFTFRFDQADMVEPGVDEGRSSTLANPVVTTLEGDPRIIENFVVRNLSFQWFRYARRVPLEGTVEANLRLVAQNGTWRLRGTLRNRTPYTLKDLTLSSLHLGPTAPDPFQQRGFQYGITPEINELKPGGTLNLDKPLNLPATHTPPMPSLTLKATSDQPLLAPEIGAQADAQSTVEFRIAVPLEVVR